MFVESSFMEKRGQARFSRRVPTRLPDQPTSTADGTSRLAAPFDDSRILAAFSDYDDSRILAAFSDASAIVVRREVAP
jgi:hypothetical protein